MLKLLIVDDHPLVREALRHVLMGLDENVTLLEAGNAAEASRLVQAHPDVDLVLLDLGLPGTNGFAAFEQLRRLNEELRVMMLSATDDRASVTTALNLGASGFMSKSFSRELILQAVRLVLAGGIFIPPQALSASESNGRKDRAGAGPSAALGLTERQSEVLALLAQGKPNKVIARELSIAEPTVKAHVTEIFRALKVANRAQAVIAARRIGFD